MDNQIAFTEQLSRTAGDAWCSSKTDGDLWDGVDFEHCFRVKLFDGILPLSFLSLSLFFFAIHALRLAYSLFFTSKGGHIRLPTDEQEASGSTPIAEAEKAVLRTVAEKQSPDWLNPATQRELLGTEEDAEDGEKGKLSTKVVARAAWGCKKDVLNLAVSAGIVAVLVLKTVRAVKAKEDGRAWVVVELVAWAWATVLVLFKLALSFSHRLFALQHPSLPHRDLSSWYITIERHLIPFICLFASLTAFFDARTALLDYHSFPYGPAKAALKLEAALFALSFFLFLIEASAPRPSRFSSRKSRGGDREAASTYIDAKGKPLPSPPELNASLFSQATWSYMEGFQLRAAFPSAYGVGSLKMDSVPDLRPDDKTARVLLAYRQSLRELDSLLQRLPAFLRRRLTRGKEHGTVDDLSLAYKLSFHFFPALVAQNVYGLIRVALNGVPPLMLKGILAHIGKRNRGEPAPTHVALLYAWFLFLGTVVGSLGSSQGLFIGRRICIRLRSIIVGEVFTKALRRKDQAGSSSSAPPTRVASPEPGGEAEVAADDAAAPTVAVKTAALGENQEEELQKIEEELEQASSGKIMNLISIDTYRLSEICAYLHFLLSEMPLSIVVVLYLLYKVLGVSALAGVAVFFAIMPIQGWIGKLYNKYQLQLLAAADQRLTLTTEVISQIRIVKYFAWERKFLEKMDITRRKELASLWKRALTTTFGGNLMFGTPILVSVVTFAVHTKILKQDLTAETAFTALALFNVLRNPLEGFTDMFVSTLQALVSLGRIDEYLHEEETHKYSILQESASVEDPKVGFVNGTFTWAGEEEARNDVGVFRIENLNLSFPEGKLSIVLGPVGSGKTTILLSLLGETNRLSGSAFLPSPVIRSSNADPTILTETTAYAAQSPWLLSATIRENILFGSLFNAKRYQATLEACALVQDLKQFELGDETEVGEKGTVLSGGQKARIALARAIYSPAKYVLLDDVLSAVDSHTAQHLVERCLSGRLMKHRTCVLVTHAVDLCLPYASYVVALEDGAVVSAGPPQSLTHSRLIELEKEQDEHAASHQPNDHDPAAGTIEAVLEGETGEEVLQHEEEERKKRLEALKLVREETQSEGAVKKEVYFAYFRAFGGIPIVLLSLGIFIAAQFADIAVNLALRFWAQTFDNKDTASALFSSAVQTSANRWRIVPTHLASSIGLAASSSSGSLTTTGIISDHAHDADFWLRMYCILALVNLVLITGRVAFYLWRGLIASKVLYDDLISSILGARIRIFDSTPTGRILNRLSKDVETIDQDLAQTSMYLTLEILMVIGIIGTISAGIPAFLPAAFVITLMYMFLGRVYLASSRELKRYESVTKSPIFSLFGEALQGVSTIRAYGDASRFMQDIFHLLDENNRPFFTLWLGNRWLSVRVDTAGAFVALLSALFIIFSPSISPSLAGFIMSFALAFNDRIIWVVRLWAQVEVQANSVERVQEYTQLDQESKGGVKPPAIWPSRSGNITVNQLTASYAPGLPSVLKSVSFEVKGGEKIGIVGRTGSGKSTLGLSFFRFIEPSSGNITIDGIDINTLRLDELRSRLTIVAQEADPFDQHSDADVWNALQRVQMAAPGATGVTPRPTPGPSRAASVASGSDDSTAAEEETERYVVKSLDMVVTEGGKNFSAGQRQLLALARGILKLKTSSILILDESTASLDHATDERIQRTIREEMADATILCIAHRLRTIIDYTKILVLDHGVVQEYDTPLNLLAKEDSAFAALCRKSGEYDLLKEMAEKAVGEKK
ncbi:Transporter of the ATP-binding cassette (ABC) [Rhodosporidiobolus nylandii]